MDKNERVETLMTAMLDNRKFVKNTVQKIYKEEIVGISVDTLNTLGPHSSPHPSITMCS
jgi:hypothetical protein